MSKSPEARARQAMRLQRRYRREKTAALIMPFFLGQMGRGVKDGEQWFATAAASAVAATDALLAELDRSDRTDLDKEPEKPW